MSGPEQRAATGLVAETDDQDVREAIDFKMVTFSLGGKDYGIDIMEVKEIAKFAHFTYVPNTAPYVRGVYNLRGEIISVIDLRVFFNLPAPAQASGQRENGLILRLENSLIGVIVDSIDRVVGLSASHVQPPHPIFGDINVKYIKGVAEHDGRLYIILDVNRIFRRDAEAVDQQPPVHYGAAAPATPREQPAPVPTTSQIAAFLRDSLATFLGFHVSAANQDWFEARTMQWEEECRAARRDPQLTNEADARTFLAPFYSAHSNALWSDDYSASVAALLPAPQSTVYNVWNPGCGSGRETFSLAVLIRRAHTNHQLKIWASDNDLLAVSNAPNLVLSEAEIPASHGEFVVDSPNGPTYAPAVKESILFEFSDVMNTAGLPPVDLVVCRDVVSFMRSDDQQRLFELFEETLRPGGVLILGDHERADTEVWSALPDTTRAAFQRR